jgi:hypothetical protein
LYKEQEVALRLKKNYQLYRVISIQRGGTLKRNNNNNNNNNNKVRLCKGLTVGSGQIQIGENIHGDLKKYGKYLPGCKRAR